jgi:UDPglucose--hexose-1-phosphate uridylyltransferase
MSEYVGKWEKRWHPLREEWIVYSAHRNARPWQGIDKISTVKDSIEYDPACYLCPGNVRVLGSKNPEYRDVFVFTNDHPVVGMEAPDVHYEDGVYKRESAKGVAKVICYDPRHNITLSQMPVKQVQRVFRSFQDETALLSRTAGIESVLIFENKGDAVGVSNPHPHCQIYATDFLFKNVEQQTRLSVLHHQKTGEDIFTHILHLEKKQGSRIIAENDHAIGFIPFFARYAYEILIFPKNRHSTLLTLSPDELDGLASVFHHVIRKLDMNYDFNFPYVMSVMQSPLKQQSENVFRMHLWIQPPFRLPGLIKYLAGPELGAGNFMADTIPEEKAAELQAINVNQYPYERGTAGVD